MLLTAGERISMALLAMAIHDRGVEAVSFTGSQAGILTDASHGGAHITEISGVRVREALDQGRVVIVAGFQGVDPDTKEITTLGRGGSDATAVALAAAHEADVCEIYTDVDGCSTAPIRGSSPAPGCCARCRSRRCWSCPPRGPGSSWRGRSSSGAVSKSLSTSGPHSTMARGPGSRSTQWSRPSSAASPTTRRRRRSRSGECPTRPGVAAALFEPLADRGINVDMIVQNVSSDGHTDISFTVPKDHAAVAREVARSVAAEVGAEAVDVDENVAKVSLVGAGMKSHPGVAARVFRALCRQGHQHRDDLDLDHPHLVRGRADQIDEAVRTLHDVFQPPMIEQEVGA